MTGGPGRLTPEEDRLADALVSLVDHTGRVLSAALGGSGPRYMAEKAASLEEAAARVKRLAEQAVGTGTVRMRLVEAAVAERSQSYVVGRLLWPLPDPGDPR